eukprot:5485418-Pyramimonas_sp.AAC.1
MMKCRDLTGRIALVVSLCVCLAYWATLDCFWAQSLNRYLSTGGRGAQHHAPPQTCICERDCAMNEHRANKTHGTKVLKYLQGSPDPWYLNKHDQAWPVTTPAGGASSAAANARAAGTATVARLSGDAHLKYLDQPATTHAGRGNETKEGEGDELSRLKKRRF